MKEKTLESFFSKIETEGFHYAFTEWGLDETYLPDDADPNLVKAVRKAERLLRSASVCEQEIMSYYHE